MVNIRMLALNNIEVVYDGVILVLKGVSLFAEEGRITTLLGTPEEIIAQLKRLEAGGVENVLFAAPGASVAGLRTFAEEIMPAFDREPMALAQV